MTKYQEGEWGRGQPAVFWRSLWKHTGSPSHPENRAAFSLRNTSIAYLLQEGLWVISSVILEHFFEENNRICLVL